ncbi:MAG: hypothetical protein R2695_14005 [Acidimicrobiales bacterium]
MPDNPTPLSIAALDDVIAPLTEIRDGYLLDQERWIEPLEQVEAVRYVGQMLSAMSEPLLGSPAGTSPLRVDRRPGAQAPGRQPRRDLPLRPHRRLPQVPRDRAGP